MVGRYDYVAPECIGTGHLNEKSDVYGFGVVLMEMLTGLRAIDTNRPEEVEECDGFTFGREISFKISIEDSPTCSLLS